MSQDLERISLGAEITRSLESGESHSYRSITLTTGQLVVVEVEQQGIDVAVELFAPDGTSIIAVDSPIGRRGTEVLVAVAETSSEHRLEVRAVEADAPPGDYRIQVRELRTATAEDRERARGERLFAQAEELRRAREETSYRQAIERYRETQPIWHTLNDGRREADTLERLGWVHISLGELRAAQDELDAALAAYSRIGDRRGEAIVLNRRGMLRWRLGETEGALGDVEEGLKRYREVGAAVLTVDALNNLGILHRRLGATEKALEFYGEARTLSRALADRRKEALTLANLGTLLLQQGRLAEAADHLEAALEIWQTSGEARREASGWNRLGDVRKRQERFDDALACFGKALALRRETGDRRGEATTLGSLGTAHLLHGKLDEAREAYEQALALYGEIDDPFGAAVVRLNLGRLELLAGRPREALAHHEQAAPLLATAGDRQIEASNLYGIARALHDLGDFATARARLEATLERVEGLRTETSSEAFRIAFFATKQHYYDLYIDVLQHLEETEPGTGYQARAFEAGERRRARALLELLGESAAEIRRGADPDRLARERDVQRRLNAHERHRLALLRARRRDAEAIAGLEKDQRELRLELEQIRSRLRRESPQYAALTQPQPSSLEEIQDRLLNPRTLLLSYSLGEDRSFLWLVSHEAISSFVLPGREEIEEAALEVHQLLKELRKSADPTRKRYLDHLGETLLGPVAAQLDDGQRLLIVAEGALLTLPFAVLTKPGTGEPLVAGHEVVHLPSASVLLALRRETAKRTAAPHQLAIYAAPMVSADGEGTSVSATGEVSAGDDLQRSAADFGIERFEPLPHAREEAEAILRIARGETLSRLGSEASKRNVLADELRDYQILHFATHGLLNRSHPELSGLVLSLYDEHGQPQDGFLRLHEIYNLELNAELVVLSACRTGLGPVSRGEGLLGLTRGFLYAGAPRVLVSLWGVSDAGTAELMKRFYWSMLETGAPPALALRAAQLSMYEEEHWSHPYYWAPFILVGEWRRPGEGDSPIEQAAGGGEVDDEIDVDYPGPDEEWCEGLPEQWMRDVCRILRRLSRPRTGTSARGQNAFHGIDALTGSDLHESLSDRQLAARILRPGGRDRREEQELGWWKKQHAKLSGDRRPAADVDPLDLASSGWGVVFLEGSSKAEAIRQAIRPLLEHRREQAARDHPKYYRDDLVYRPGETKAAFFKRYDLALGPAHPKKLPYYLLLIGDPVEIPHRFQYLLDLQYAVGRLSFDDVESYARYAESVVAVERGEHHVHPEMQFFSVVHEGDQATEISAEKLIQPLRRFIGEERGEWIVELTEKGRRADLGRFLGEETPALLFTACHGLGYRSGHPLQTSNQGAILCQDWPGHGPPRPEHYFAAADLGDDARVQGLIAFLFGCYSAGTPHMDNFPPPPLRNPIERAPQPLVSPLARRLLSHPNGSALAVLGHVDRTWTRSFGAGRGMGYLHILSLLKMLLDGYPVGAAMDWMHERFAEISTELTNVLDRYDQLTVDTSQLAGLWRANNDARNFVVLGDPAVRVAVGPRAALLRAERSPERRVESAPPNLRKVVGRLRTREPVTPAVRPSDAVRVDREGTE